MKRTLYLSAALIASLTACKQNEVIVNHTATAAGTTANIVVNEQGVDTNMTSTGAIDVNTTATNEATPANDTGNATTNGY